MTSKQPYVRPGSPRDRSGRRHFCQDETATIVNDRWFCNCPGAPFYTSEQALAGIKDTTNEQAETKGGNDSE